VTGEDPSRVLFNAELFESSPEFEDFQAGMTHLLGVMKAKLEERVLEHKANSHRNW
jgi:hypothetical protein